MIQGRTILCFASGYNAPPTSKHHVMWLLAEQNVVLWVNYHASRAPSATAADLGHVLGKLALFCRGRSHPRENLYVLTPLLLPLPGRPWARRVNRRLLLGRVRKALQAVGRGPVQVWSFAPDVAYLLDGLEAEKVLYYCVDDFAHFTGYDPAQVGRDEGDLCRRADLVVTASEALHRAKAPLNPRTILVPHGVDHGHFSRALSDEVAVPGDLAAIPRPRLGFFGLIRDWVDLDLLAGVARARPAWHVVLIGHCTVDASPLRSLPNVHLLGPRPYALLPGYCRGFDVGLVPFRLNELTRAANPIKLREYLSAGLAVVSTPLPEARRYRPLVRLAGTVEEFVAAVEAALGETAERRAVRSRAVAGETWRDKVELICDRLQAGAADGRNP